MDTIKHCKITLGAIHATVNTKTAFSLTENGAFKNGPPSGEIWKRMLGGAVWTDGNEDFRKADRKCPRGPFICGCSAYGKY